MSARNRRAAVTASLRGSAGIAAAALVLTGSTGCSVVQKLNNIRHAVDANKKVIETFAQGLRNGKAVPFEATYVTTGTAPTTVVYAARPPKDVAFKETSTSGDGASDVDLIANSSGEFSCSQSSQGAQWSCAKLGTASSIAQNQLFAIYTPTHWIAFLEGLSIAAGVAGDHVTTSSMTVNGFALNCVNFTGKDFQAKSTICTTSQGILGYVNVGPASNTFEIKGYTGSPPTSDFELPPGATVTSPGNGG